MYVRANISLAKNVFEPHLHPQPAIEYYYANTSEKTNPLFPNGTGVTLFTLHFVLVFEGEPNIFIVILAVSKVRNRVEVVRVPR